MPAGMVPPLRSWPAALCIPPPPLQHTGVQAEMVESLAEVGDVALHTQPGEERRGERID